VQDRIADTNVVVDETLQGIQKREGLCQRSGWEALRYGVACKPHATWR
jgi:hypothetical protein